MPPDSAGTLCDRLSATVGIVCTLAHRTPTLVERCIGRRFEPSRAFGNVGSCAPYELNAIRRNARGAVWSRRPTQSVPCRTPVGVPMQSPPSFQGVAAGRGTVLDTRAGGCSKLCKWQPKDRAAASGTCHPCRSTTGYASLRPRVTVRIRIICWMPCRTTTTSELHPIWN